ncbi:MAG: PhzF family phenazine biosynthesis protein, partial [Candidatus Krumholzibacteria bacterium]|nr:PhzF family phenazine biosynthesis protein [Candidatus Krumholzibacteria bacterium]
MSTLTIKQVDAFTTTPFGGNPAGVITDCSGLGTEDMLRIAGEMNLTETAFVTAAGSDDALARIRFFTPSSEVDLSGHAVIAVSWALAEEGRIWLGEGTTTVVLETNAGPIPVEMEFHPAPDPATAGDRIALRTGTLCGELHRIMMLQEIHGHKESPIPADEIADILGIPRSEITGTGLPVEVISVGLDQLMIPIISKETILDLNPDLIKLGILNRRHGIDTNHVFTTDTFSSDCTSYARHFAPALGMLEDPGTGTAAAGLGTYLVRHGIVTPGRMIMEQGNDSSALARIIVEVAESSGAG